MAKPVPTYDELLKSLAGGFAMAPLDKQALAKSHTRSERRKRLGEIFADKDVSDEEADELDYLKEDQEKEEGMEKSIRDLEALAKGEDFWDKEDDDERETKISPAVKKAAIKKFGKWSAVAAAWAAKQMKAKD